MQPPSPSKPTPHTAAATPDRRPQRRRHHASALDAGRSRHAAAALAGVAVGRQRLPSVSAAPDPNRRGHRGQRGRLGHFLLHSAHANAQATLYANGPNPTIRAASVTPTSAVFIEDT
jgi:hypothetical protein